VFEDNQNAGCLVLLARLAKVIARAGSEQALGMRLRHFIALSYLRDHAHAPQQQLCEMLCIDANNLVLLLNELEDGGLVRRRRDQADRRRHLVELTAGGRRALERAARAQQRIEAEVLAPLSVQDRATLRELLSRAVANSGAPAAGEPILAAAPGA
jgi:DNA-binding MarR family transcriptional regulator